MFCVTGALSQKSQAQIQDPGLQTILSAEVSVWHFLSAVCRGCLKGGSGQRASHAAEAGLYNSHIAL